MVWKILNRKHLFCTRLFDFILYILQALKQKMLLTIFWGGGLAVAALQVTLSVSQSVGQSTKTHHTLAATFSTLGGWNLAKRGRTFVAPTSILLMIRRANLILIRLKCAPEKSLFERPFSPNPSPCSSISTIIGTPLWENVNAQHGGVGLSGRGKGWNGIGTLCHGYIEWKFQNDDCTALFLYYHESTMNVSCRYFSNIELPNFLCLNVIMQYSPVRHMIHAFGLPDWHLDWQTGQSVCSSTACSH